MLTARFENKTFSNCGFGDLHTGLKGLGRKHFSECRLLIIGDSCCSCRILLRIAYCKHLKSRYKSQSYQTLKWNWSSWETTRARLKLKLLEAGPPTTKPRTEWYTQLWNRHIHTSMEDGLLIFTTLKLWKIYVRPQCSQLMFFMNQHIVQWAHNLHVSKMS